MEKIHMFEKENTISFSDQKSLILFVSEYFAFRYKKHCEFWKATATDSPAEMAMWDERSESEAPRLQKALKHSLNRKLFFRNSVSLTRKSTLFKSAFKKAKMSCEPDNCIPCNVEYKIDGLVFKRDVKDHPIN